MKRIINYINRKQRTGLELKLKMQYTDIMGWNIKIHIKGYDMPLIEVEDMDLDNAINKTHEMLRKVEKMNIKVPIGFLCIGDYFKYDNKVYRVGRLIENTNGYVACVDENKKVRRFHIDNIVEVSSTLDE